MHTPLHIIRKIVDQHTDHGTYNSTTLIYHKQDENEEYLLTSLRGNVGELV